MASMMIWRDPSGRVEAFWNKQEPFTIVVDGVEKESWRWRDEDTTIAAAKRYAAKLQNQAGVLAKKFAELIREQLTPAELAEIIRRNRTPHYRDRGCCATHDFMDANMPMLTAFREIMERDINADSDADTRLWNQAWDIARNKEFWT